jgi:hypothetical protein
MSPNSVGSVKILDMLEVIKSDYRACPKYMAHCIGAKSDISFLVIINVIERWNIHSTYLSQLFQALVFWFRTPWLSDTVKQVWDIFPSPNNQKQETKPMAQD